MVDNEIKILFLLIKISENILKKKFRYLRKMCKKKAESSI